jgi:hypothetical protein
MLERIKWALKGFEGISGLKINFSKSELIPLNLSESETITFASILQCKIDTLPLKYLGLPLRWKKPSKSDWEVLITKVQKRLPY